MEDYLEAVGFLSDDGEGSVRVTDIADKLGVSKPSVLTAIKALEDRGFVEHERYRGVTLTATGKVRSAEIQSRHEFLRAFLRNVVDVPDDIAEKDACRMEHVLSEATLERMRLIAAASTPDHTRERQ